MDISKSESKDALVSEKKGEVTECGIGEDVVASELTGDESSIGEDEVAREPMDKPEVDATVVQPFVDLLRNNYNLVLTGAPGTGKTTLAKSIAYAMGAKETMGFVQFHPSYDYTDFVEGLRPTLSPKGEGEAATSFSFARKDGVFKVFCKKALSGSLSKEKAPAPTTSFEDLLESIKKDIDAKVLTTYSKTGVLSLDAKTRRIRYRKRTIYEDNLKLLFDYYVAHQAEFESVSRESMGKTLEKLTLSRSKATKTIDFTEYKWTLAELLKRKKEKEGVEESGVESVSCSKPFVFIIDEINRGELSKIFGELFYSIDPGYRGKKGSITTQYQNLIDDPSDVFKDGFYVPENVYIIGTMNDIDRGVESMDFAIRRRFTWREVTAEESAKNMKLPAFAVKKMQKVNEAIIKSGLGEEFCIGGAYFRELKDEDECQDLWDYHLNGVISEYFRGNPKRNEKVEEIKNAFLAVDKSSDEGSEITEIEGSVEPENEGSE